MGLGIRSWLVVMHLSLIVLMIPVVCIAEEPKEQASPVDFLKAFEKAQQEGLERLKQEDPLAYQQQKAASERQKKIQEVLDLYFQGKLSAANAQYKLSPLIKQQLQEEGAFSNLEARIRRLDEQLAFLKKAKNQPELLVQERIDQMLGKGAASAADRFGF